MRLTIINGMCLTHCGFDNEKILLTAVCVCVFELSDGS